MRLQESVVVDRPVAELWRWYALGHVANHPRWDPDIELWATSEGPIGLGSVLRRRNSRSGAPVEGTMEVVDFEHERLLGMSIREGATPVYGFATFEALDADHTRLTIGADIPWLDESADTNFLTSRLRRSTANIKRLAEAEIAPVPGS